MGSTTSNVSISKVESKYKGIAALKRSRAERIDEVLSKRIPKDVDKNDLLDVHKNEVCDKTDREALLVDPANYDFDFENLVLEGGGSKGIAYCGAVRYLEEIGQMQKIRNLAGASIGGVFAVLLAVGYNSDELEEFVPRLDTIVYGVKSINCCFLTPIADILDHFGVYTGNQFHEWLGDKIQNKVNNKDITFKELYEETGKTLCIVVTDVNLKITEYCHPKTTPDVPIRLATRMSMGIPGIFKPIKFQNHGFCDLFVDGSLLCNYPIFCFDGWFLSMAPEDSFLQRLCPLNDIPRLMERKERFSPYNNKTLGLVVHSDMDEDAPKFKLLQRFSCMEPKIPEKKTKLYKKYLQNVKTKSLAVAEQERIVRAVDDFMKVLKKHDLDRNDIISLQELQAAFKDETVFPKESQECLFGKDYTVQDAFKLLDTNGDGQIQYQELEHFITESGVMLMTRYSRFERQEITSFRQFVQTLVSAVVYYCASFSVEENDLDRTVGINTGYVGTLDFKMEEADGKFIIMRGYNSMRAFLQHYVVNHRATVREKQSLSQTDDVNCNQ